MGCKCMSLSALWQELKSMSRRDLCKLVLLVALLIGFSALFLWLLADGYVVDFLDWVDDLGFWGVAFLGMFYLIFAFPLPIAFAYSSVNLGAGYIYGVWKGCLVICILATLGTMLCLLVCRKGFRGWLERKLAARPRAAALHRVLESHGYKMIALLRWTPLPWGVQNGILSLSKQKYLGVCAVASLASLPERLVSAYLGSQLKELSDLIDGNEDESSGEKAGKIAILVAQVVGVITVFVVVGYLAERTVRRWTAEDIANDPRTANANETLDGKEDTEMERLDDLKQGDGAPATTKTDQDAGLPHDDCGDEELGCYEALPGDTMTAEESIVITE